MNQTISVIIPVYNVEAYLDECIRSVVAQTYSSLEILLVDDGSPDNCGAICDAWAARDCRIRVIHRPNGGLSDARNAGLDSCTGDYIAFVDSDDWIKADMYEKLYAALQQEGADICACNVFSCYPDRQIAWGCKAYTVGDSETFLAMLYSDTAYPVCAWNKLYRRSCWEGLRFPVGKLCEDAFTAHLLVDRAEKIVQLPDALYCHRIRSGSIMTLPFQRARMDEEQAWRHSCQFTAAHYPQLRKLAFDFYLQKVNTLLHAIAQTQRQKFAGEYAFLRGILRKNLAYILFASRMSLKKRAKLLCDYWGM